MQRSSLNVVCDMDKQQISSLDDAKRVIDGIIHIDYDITFKSPIRITFDYITEDNYDTWDEANATEITYYPLADEIWVTTDDEYYGEIPLDSLWASAIQAIAEALNRNDYDTRNNI